MQGTVRVRGLREFQRAVRQADKDTKKAVRDELKEAGDLVRDEWDRRFRVVDAHSASRYRVSVRQGGIWVQQSLRKKTGLRPDYGGLQMRYGREVLADKQAEIEREFEKAIDRVADRLEG